MIVSHKYRFIYVRQRKTASTSIMVALAPLLGDEDICSIKNPTGRIAYNKRIDNEPFMPVVGRNMDNISMEDAHMLPQQIIDVVGQDIWDNYFKFVVVRNPWDWSVSLIAYLLKMEALDVSRPFIKNILRLFIKAPIDPQARYRLKQLIKQRLRILDGYYHIHLRKKNYKECFERLILTKVYGHVLRTGEDYYFPPEQGLFDSYLRYENLNDDFDQLCRRIGLPQTRLPRTKTKIRNKLPRDYRVFHTDQTKEYIGECFHRTIEHFNYQF